MRPTDHLAAALRASGQKFAANDNIADHLGDGDRAQIQVDVEEACHALLRALVIDTASDPNTKETARRMAKMFVREVFRGRYEPMPALKDFPNQKNLDEVYLVGPVTVRSACSHHFVPIVGKCWFGVIPGERVIGLSKFARLADWIFRRPQIQEESTIQLADIIESTIKPKALAVVVEAEHLCMTWRGVEETSSKMTTSVMRGLFREETDARAEFLRLLSQSRNHT